MQFIMIEFILFKVGQFILIFYSKEIGFFSHYRNGENESQKVMFQDYYLSGEELKIIFFWPKRGSMVL
jgi:hypothetical protein